MKILFFIGHLESGGGERVVSILSNELVNRGFDVEILTYYHRQINYQIDKKVKITSVVDKAKGTNYLKNINWLSKYFKENADVIISFLAPFNIFALIANISTNIPIIVADRNDPNRIPANKFIRKIRDILYKKADYVVVQTESNKEYFNYIGDKVVVISNPIDLKEYAGKALQTKKKNKIVSVGRLMPQKNQTMLIEAFSEFVKNHEDYELVIYGEGSYRDVLENKIEELSLKESVKLPGETNKVFDEIEDAKLFVLSSNYEGMPNALIEAMCLGLPVISTNVSGANDLIINEENGILIDINDSKQLLERMNQLIADESFSNKLANNAIKLNADLNINTIVDRWQSLINKACR